MKVYGSFNKLSKDTVPPKLKKGQTVVYKLLKNPHDPDNPTKPTFPMFTRIKTMFRVFDPKGGEDGSGAFVDVGLIKGMDKEKNPIPAPASYFDQSGTLILMGGRADHEELYEIMELSNENISNPHREVNDIEPKYKRVDLVKESKAKTALRTQKLEAMTYVTNLSDTEARKLAASLGWDENADMAIIHEQLLEHAENNPKVLLDFVDDPIMSIKALAKVALTKDILKWDLATKRMLWGASGQPIATLEVQDGKTYLDAFADWILLSKKGDETMKMIDDQLDQSMKKKKD